MANPYTVNGLDFYVKNGVSTALEPIMMDIETANNHAEKVEDLRTWMVSCQIWFRDEYVFCRKPEEVVEWLRGLYKRFRLYPSKDLKKRMIIYIHNASYDLSYLIPYFNDLPDFSQGQGIIPKLNHFITYIRGSLEFRCSYYLSGMSLEKWSAEMNIEHKKLVGFYDYDKVLYQDSELNEDEQDYDKIDVVAMKECLDKQFAYHKDNLVTVPYTKTGYIRRILRRSCKNDPDYRNTYFKATKLDAELYEAMNHAYAGGYTHNNRFKSQVLVKHKIGHRDFKSHYPTQMAVNLFPIGKPTVYYDYEIYNHNIDIEEVLNLSPEYSTLTKIIIWKAQLKTKSITMPFMQFSKCVGHMKKVLDNGRILKAESDEGFILYLTDYDLKIINEQYNLEYAILKVWQMKNGPLPDCILEIVDKYFKGKSDLKNKVHKLTEAFGKLDPRTVEAQFDLQQFKALLNAIYGCCATNPLRDSWQIDDEFNFSRALRSDDPETVQEQLDKFYSRRNNFLPYQWGVWITAMARYELYEYIVAIGYENTLYCDTDSIFYLKSDEVEKVIEALNAAKKEKARYVVLDNGKKEYYDVFDSEPDGIAFKGLHSKCYGMVTDKGLELTIAGVPAKTLIGMKDGKPVYMTREEEVMQQGIPTEDPIEGLDRLKFGLTFTINTGKTAVYIGNEGKDTPRVPKTIMVDGHEISTAGGCVIKTTEKKVIREMAFGYDYEEDIFGINN